VSGHDHGHPHGAGARRAGARHQRRLGLAFAITSVFLVVEVVAGFWTNSLALLSDAGHMFTDVLGLGMALAAISLANQMEARHRSSGERGPHTFGLYRLEILAAFVNAMLLFGVAIWVIAEAIQRITETPEVLGRPMLAVAVLGLLANLVAFALLRDGAAESVNVEGAYLEVLADALGSVGVIVAAVLLEVFGWAWVDPLIAAVIGLWILPRTWRLGRRSVRILIQAAPPHIDPEEVAGRLGAIAGVIDVHDLHLWTLTSDMESASAHLTVGSESDIGDVLIAARRVLHDGYGVSHATLQVAPLSGECCEELEW
jgi:cobalt-zinc-cadmium efflux system protein